MTTDAELAVAAGLPTVGEAVELADRLDQTNPALVLPAQLALAQQRAAWLGEQLRVQVARDGVRGVVGDTYAVTLDGVPIKVSEYTRVLFEQEGRERDRVAVLADRIARLGLASVRDGVNRDLGHWVAEGMKRMAAALGHPLEDGSVALAAAQRIAIAMFDEREGVRRPG